MEFNYTYLCGFLLLLTLTFCSSSSINDKLVVSKVSRTIDVSTQLVKVSLELSLENTDSAEVNFFLLSIDPNYIGHLAYVGASIKSKNEEDEEKLVVQKAEQKDAGFWKVTLTAPLKPGKSVAVNVEEVFSNLLTPYPAAIGQSEKQLVVFEGNHYFYSPYSTKSQTTTVKLASSAIESHSKLKPTSVSDRVITYGPYNNIKPLSKDAMKIHYENNSPFSSVLEMTRLVELSHWGNIAVEESFTVEHVGAKLKGTFSRYDYQRTPTHAAIKSFKVALPASARDVYYRDAIGNISTSNMLVQEDAVEVELRPRFPLFGGWKTQYYIGYNVPAYEYLYNRGNKYGLKMRFIDHVFDDFLVKDLTVKIILPEGVKDIKVKTPFEVSEEKRELHFTYLDTVGRPVIVLKKNDVVENHIQDMEIHYSFQRLLLLQEPLLVVGSFYLFFILVIIIVRLDFSITKDAAREARMKAAGLLDELVALLEKRNGCSASYDTEVNKFKLSRDQAGFSNTLKRMNADYIAANNKVASHQTALLKEDPDANDKLQELQKKEHERKQLIDQAVLLAQKVVSNKIGKQQYLDNSQNNQSKRDRLTEEIEAITSSL